MTLSTRTSSLVEQRHDPMAPITSVRAACLTVSDYFSQTARHQLPLFQRAYVWGEDQVKKLVGDVEEVPRMPAGPGPTASVT